MIYEVKYMTVTTLSTAQECKIKAMLATDYREEFQAVTGEYIQEDLYANSSFIALYEDVLKATKFTGYYNTPTYLITGLPTRIKHRKERIGNSNMKQKMFIRYKVPAGEWCYDDKDFNSRDELVTFIRDSLTKYDTDIVTLEHELSTLQPKLDKALSIRAKLRMDLNSLIIEEGSN